MSGYSAAVKTMPQLEFEKEYKEIKHSIGETDRLLRIKSIQATISNLTNILTKQPLALHFTGHGIENTKENLGRSYQFRQKEGNFLLFESDDGEAELVSEKTLGELIDSSKTKLEFVFVATCHSEFAGRIFLNAGAKHVICVKQSEAIADLAVVTFSKIFYQAVCS